MKRKRLKKAAVFTLDALLAALLVIGAYFIVIDIKPVTLSQPTTQYELLHYAAEDAMELFSLKTFSELNATQQQELLDTTDIDESDVNKSLIDIIALLWATNNITQASNISGDFFSTVLPQDVNYRLLVQDIDGNVTLIRDQNATAPRVSANSYATKASRLVSGFKQNKTVSGYIARSIAVKSDKNTTTVFDINPEGSGHTAQSSALRITKKFYLPVNSTEDIYEGKVYMSIHLGSPTDEGTYQINGNPAMQFESMDGYIDEEKDNTHLLFGSNIVTSQLVPGWNTLIIKEKSNQFHSHVHPGTRIEVTYKTNETASRTNPIQKTEYLDNIFSDSQGSQRSGVWTIVPAYVPQGSSVHKAELFLSFIGVTNDAAKDDIQVYFNGVSVQNVSNPSANQTMTVDLTTQLNNNLGKTNVISVFANVFFTNPFNDNNFWGTSDLTLYSDPQNNASGSSRLFLNYSIPLTKKKYGYIDVSFIEPFNGSRGNPKLFTTDFQGHEAESVFLHLAQLDNVDVTVKTSYGSTTNTVFDTPMLHSTPTEIFIDKSKFEYGVMNTVNVSDICDANEAGEEDSCDILANSSLEYEILVPSQVGYGDTFNTPEEAQEDANRRLNETLAPYADILQTDLYTLDSVSSAPIPYLYGPVTVTLELWR